MVRQWHAKEVQHVPPPTSKFWYSPTLWAMSDCFVWHSSLPPWYKQFSCIQSAVTKYKGHLQLKRSTTKWHIKTTLLCPTCMYDLQTAELFHGVWWRYGRRAWCRKPRYMYLACILRLHPLLSVMWALCCDYVKMKSHALIALSRLSSHFLERSLGTRLLNQGVTRQ